MKKYQAAVNNSFFHPDYRMTYRKGASWGYDECVEITFTAQDKADCLSINVTKLCNGIRKYRTNRGFQIELPTQVQFKILQLVQAEREKILAAYPVKTYVGWSESGIDNFDGYCKPGDEVDEAMTDYFLNALPPVTYRSNLIQCGEAFSHELDESNGRIQAAFITFKLDGGKWYYCGECFAGQTQNRTKISCGVELAIRALAVIATEKE